MATLRDHLDNPNVRKFLNYISEAEGTTQYGYYQSFGNKAIDSLEDHPRKMFKFKGHNTSPAGRYQIVSSTWNDISKKLGLTDFSPESQDLAALELIRRRGALNDVLSGDFVGAINKLGSEWAAFPSSKYGQPKRNWEWTNKKLAELGADTPTYDPSTFSPESFSAASSPAGLSYDTIQQIGQASELPTIYDVLRPDRDVRADLLSQALTQDVNTIQQNAVNQFIGADSFPGIDLPDEFQREINRIVANL